MFVKPLLICGHTVYASELIPAKFQHMLERIKKICPEIIKL
jgi:hypothetical protein